MTWMLTTTGAAVDLTFIGQASISLLDIAHALANLNRFTGHACRPYSVAEHSLFVVEIMERELGVHAPEVLLAGLLHDAHEAYTGDLSTPMKQLIGPAWAVQEQRIEHDVLHRFGVLAQALAHAATIKRADLIALATERRDLLPAGGPAWPTLAHVQPCEWIQLHTRAGMDWADWRQAYLDRFAVLYSCAADAALAPQPMEQ